MKILKLMLTILVSLALVACGTANTEASKPEAKKATESTNVPVATSNKSAKIAGSFSGTIIDFYPDYVTDDVTIKKILIQIPQQGLFLLNIDENLNLEKIEKNKLYRFIIKEYDLKNDNLFLVLNNKYFFSRAGGSTLLSMFGKEIVIDAVEENADNSWGNNLKILIE